MRGLDERQRLLYEMLRIRRIEESIANEYSNKTMRCPVHLSVGQEAVSVGVCSKLSKSDYVFSTHRSHGHYLAKGGDLSGMLAELFGKASGCSSGKGGSMHLIDRAVGFLGATPIVGSTIPIGVGAALSSRLDGEDRITTVFLGDGAVEEGVFHESLNFAALKRLPVLFVCENNFYSVYSSMKERQPNTRSIAELVSGHGIWSRQADGNDLDSVQDLTSQALSEIKAGKGPAFLEFRTYRFLAHCGPSQDIRLGYRKAEELEQWMSRCPIKLYEQKLCAESKFNDELRSEMEEQIREEITESLNAAIAAPFPSADQLLSDVYREAHA